MNKSDWIAIAVILFVATLPSHLFNLDNNPLAPAFQRLLVHGEAAESWDLFSESYQNPAFIETWPDVSSGVHGADSIDVNGDAPGDFDLPTEIRLDHI